MYKKIIQFVTNPIEKFIKIEASSGIVLMACAVVAMFLANSSIQSSYYDFLNSSFFSLSVLHWVNDALMAIFFFVVGLEIKKEMVVGELKTFKKSALPIVSAIGGMVIPAFIYYYFNKDLPSISGWAIPMATDIAFALGILSLFGSRVPLSLKVFLLVLAIVDDIGAVLIIALFYTEKISLLGLALAGLALLFVTISRKLGVRSYYVYLVWGSVAWVGVLYSGLHATIAGALLGLMTPYSFPIAKSSKETYSPIEDLIHYLHPVVGFLIMPVFALCNAGISLEEIEISAIIENRVSLGVILGLLFGKPLGIMLFSGIFVSWKIAVLPHGVSWKNLLGVSVLAGIGFTMSIFIATLGLTSSDLSFAKIGILVGSILSSLLGSFILFRSLK